MAHVTVADVATRVAYTVGGTPQSAFTIPFAYFDPTDIVVYVGGVLKTYLTDFSVSGVAVDGGYSGGTVTLTVAVSNTTVVVQRDTPTARTEDFPYPSSTLNIKALNTALDKIAAWAQQLKAKAARALRQPDADTGDIGQLPAKTLRANTALIFDANGDPAVGVTPGLTLPVAIAQGGTGQTTENAALYALIAGATVDTAPNIATDKIPYSKNTGATGRALTIQAFWNLLASLTSYTALNSADEMALRDGSGGGAGVRRMTIANFLAGIGAQGRNIAGRNGGLEVWQRGAGGSASISVAASTTAYTADGWALKTGANQASTVAQVAGIATGSRWAARVRRNSGQTGTGAMNFEFPLDTDEIVFMQGCVVTLSMTLQAGANWSPTSGNLTIELRTGTGSAAKRSAGAYTGDAAPISVTQSVSASATRYTFTSTALGASVTQASIYLTWTPTGTAGANDWFAIDDVQLEVSPVATAFERRPFEAELRACERHYEKSYDYATAPGAVTTNGAHQIAAYVAGLTEWGHSPFRTRKRVAPTVTIYSTGTGAAGNVRATGADIAATAALVGETAFAPRLTTAGADNLRWHFAADAGI